MLSSKSNHRMTTKLKKCKSGKGQANHVKTTKELNGSLLLVLPRDLIINILIKLPIYSIFSCKCVCTTLKKNLSDSDFAQCHLANKPANDFSLVIQDVAYSSNIIFAPTLDLGKPAVYSKTTDHYGVNYHSWQTLISPASIPKTKHPDHMTRLIGSCNGLLCVSYAVKDIVFYYVCNPILGEFTILPQSMPYIPQNAAFGFCPKTNQYKVLRFFPLIKTCEILTFGTDKWRKISDIPPFICSETYFDSSYKGNLHWIVWVSRGEQLICSFNLETEQYSYMSLPSCFDKALYARLRHVYVGTLDGLFCICCTLFPGHFEVYVMEDYGVKESWIKKISINIGCHFSIREILIFGFLDNGVLVLISDYSSVLYYDTRKGTISDVDAIVTDRFYNAMAHVPSFITIKNIVRREHVEEVERKMLRVFSSKARVHTNKHLP